MKKLIMTFKNTLIVFNNNRHPKNWRNRYHKCHESYKEKNIFQPKGYDIAECVSAKVVDSTTTEYNLTI